MLSALRNFAITFAISAVIFGVIAYFVGSFVLDTATDIVVGEDGNGEEFTVVTPETDEPDEADPEATPDEFESLTGESFNVLFIGSDYQSMFDKEYSIENTYKDNELPDLRNRVWTADTLIVMSVDKERHRFTFCSVPSNMQVICDGMNVKLGDILSLKGEAELARYVTGRTGLGIDYYIHVNLDKFDGFVYSTVGALGNFSYTAPCDMKYEDPEQDLTINIKKGQKIDTAAEAIELLRFKNYTGSLTRGSVTIDFMKTLISAYTERVQSVDTYLSLYRALKGVLAKDNFTNITENDIIHNLDLLLTFNKFECREVTYPGKETLSGGEIYFIPDVTAVINLFGQE